MLIVLKKVSKNTLEIFNNFKKKVLIIVTLFLNFLTKKEVNLIKFARPIGGIGIYKSKGGRDRGQGLLTSGLKTSLLRRPHYKITSYYIPSR